MCNNALEYLKQRSKAPTESVERTDQSDEWESRPNLDREVKISRSTAVGGSGFARWSESAGYRTNRSLDVVVNAARKANMMEDVNSVTAVLKPSASIRAWKAFRRSAMAIRVVRKVIVNM